MDLRFFRVLAGKPQRELARQVGRSQSWVHLIEVGYCFASEEDKALIAEALNVSVTDIEWPEKSPAESNRKRVTAAGECQMKCEGSGDARNS